MTESGLPQDTMTELHPIRKGAMLRLTDDQEDCDELVEVTQRLRDIDSEHIEYVLSDPTHTRYHTYHQDDVDDLFADTGLTNDEPKPVMDDKIRSLFQKICWHSFHTVHDEDGNEIGEQCIHCRVRKELVA